MASEKRYTNTTDNWKAGHCKRHGARSCPLCEADSEIARLRAENERLESENCMHRDRETRGLAAIVHDTTETEVNRKAITMCAACRTVACWDGVAMCDEARTAGTVEVSDGE